MQVEKVSENVIQGERKRERKQKVRQGVDKMFREGSVKERGPLEMLKSKLGLISAWFHCPPCRLKLSSV
jgi:hypothetical protein